MIAAVRDAALRFRDLGAIVSRSGAAWEDPAPFVAATFDMLDVGWPGRNLASTPPPVDLRSALEARARAIGRLRDVVRTHDLLLSPTVQAVAPTAELWSERWPSRAHDYLCFTMMFNWVGWPALTVPCGLVDGLPVGLQIVGPPGSDALVLRAAQAFHAAAPPLGPAGYAPTKPDALVFGAQRVRLGACPVRTGLFRAFAAAGALRTPTTFLSRARAREAKPDGEVGYPPPSMR